MKIPIKIRAWDDVEKKFHTFLSVGEKSGEGSVQFFGNEKDELVIGRLEYFDTGMGINDEFTSFPQHLFTGLKDKHDVEIYDGDIVKRHFEIGSVAYDEDSYGVVGYDIEESGYFIGVVCYRPSAGFILNQCKKYNDDNEIVSKRSGVKIHGQYAEVIGNIYEHPHLLTGGESNAS